MLDFLFNLKSEKLHQGMMSLDFFVQAESWWAFSSKIATFSIADCFLSLFP